MRPKRSKPKLWPFLLLAGLGVLLFAIQPLLSGGRSGLAATTTPTVEGTPAATGTAVVTPVATATPAPTGPKGFSSGDILGLVARLAVVIVIIFVSMYLLRIFTNRTRGGGATGNVVRILDTIALGNNQKMYLVDAGDKILLVGATQQALNLLSELNNPETLSAIRSPKAPSASAGAAAATMNDLVRRAGAHFALPKMGARKSAEGHAFPSMTETLQRMLRGETDPTTSVAGVATATTVPSDEV